MILALLLPCLAMLLLNRPGLVLRLVLAVLAMVAIASASALWEQSGDVILTLAAFYGLVQFGRRSQPKPAAE